VEVFGCKLETQSELTKSFIIKIIIPINCDH